ncbi:VanZ family protein [Paraliobacillus ryukyuensis]|uniref:VanZ family protein n=1 Tax=Paraliobacillus ryukyuensis TaxID=200904 RepID=UPI0015C49D1E|nr:VanZ family protein [Paraliobacillus ryukyuensis]
MEKLGGDSWNLFRIIDDIRGDTASLIVMIINIIIFLPFYFLLAHSNIFERFLPRFLIFVAFSFSIEYLQVQFKVGIFDLADILLYNVGFFVGYIISLPVLHILKNNLGIKK